MKFFDLHCDTSTVMYAKKNDFSDTSMHISEKGLENYEKAYQTCAVFIADGQGGSGFEYFCNVMDYFLPVAAKVKNLVPIVACEGGRCIDGNVDNINKLKEKYGLRVFGLVHNGENELACGGATDNGRGLTETGKEAVIRCEELGITPDVSHLSDAGFDDLVKICKKPFIATHSNCRSIYGHLRNLTDDQLKEIFGRKGIVGLNLFPDIICQDPHITDLLKHAEKMLELGGEDCIAMGGDLDGIVSVPRDFKDVSSYTDIRKMFAEAFSEEIAEKIMFKNAARFFGAE